MEKTLKEKVYTFPEIVEYYSSQILNEDFNLFLISLSVEDYAMNIKKQQN